MHEPTLRPHRRLPPSPRAHTRQGDSRHSSGGSSGRRRSRRVAEACRSKLDGALRKLLEDSSSERLRDTQTVVSENVEGRNDLVEYSSTRPHASLPTTVRFAVRATARATPVWREAFRGLVIFSKLEPVDADRAPVQCACAAVEYRRPPRKASLGSSHLLKVVRLHGRHSIRS